MTETGTNRFEAIYADVAERKAIRDKLNQIGIGESFTVRTAAGYRRRLVAIPDRQERPAQCLFCLGECYGLCKDFACQGRERHDGKGVTFVMAGAVRTSDFMRETDNRCEVPVGTTFLYIPHTDGYRHKDARWYKVVEAAPATGVEGDCAIRKYVGDEPCEQLACGRGCKCGCEGQREDKKHVTYISANAPIDRPDDPTEQTLFEDEDFE